MDLILSLIFLSEQNWSKKEEGERLITVYLLATEAGYFATFSLQIEIISRKIRMVSGPHSTPFNGTWASLVSKAGNSFHKGPEALEMTITLLPGSCQNLYGVRPAHSSHCNEKHSRVLQNEDSSITTSICSTAVRETSVSNMYWCPDDILRRWQVHSNMEKEICSIYLAGIDGHRQHYSY